MAEELIKKEAPTGDTDIHHVCTPPVGANCEGPLHATHSSQENELCWQARGSLGNCFCLTLDKLINFNYWQLSCRRLEVSAGPFGVEEVKSDVFFSIYQRRHNYTRGWWRVNVLRQTFLWSFPKCCSECWWRASLGRAFLSSYSRTGTVEVAL